MSALPGDYLERVYAGVLGKIVGVYLGRPFEGWTHQRILEELGPIKSYVHEKVGVPLVVTDDDVSGTFQFVRALEEHGVSPFITSEAVGKTWLNNVIAESRHGLSQQSRRPREKNCYVSCRECTHCYKA